VKILEEEVRRRGEAQALAMLAKADQELTSLRVERDTIERRIKEISALKEEAHERRMEGERLVSEYAPPLKTSGKITKTKAKKKASPTPVEEEPVIYDEQINEDDEPIYEEDEAIYEE
jgi:hypothetical protein